MIASAILSAFLASLQVIAAIHLENPIVTAILGLIYIAMLFFALSREEKLLYRITELEEKLNEYESEDNE